jgi:hypothetical protein
VSGEVRTEAVTSVSVFSMSTFLKMKRRGRGGARVPLDEGN